jgi:hypothetical protein
MSLVGAVVDVLSDVVGDVVVVGGVKLDVPLSVPGLRVGC